MKICISFLVDDDISVADKELIISELRKAWHESRVASCDWECQEKSEGEK